VSSAAEIGPRAVPPARFALFHPDQHAHPAFAYRPFLASTRVRWTEGVAIETDAPACLPAQLVYLAADALEERGEVPIGYATSSGMACAPTADGAILAGLLELIERDAVMLTWYLQQSPPRLHWRGDPRLRVVEERCFVPSGLRYLCLDLSEPLGVATVLAVVFGTDVGLAVGAGSALMPQDAWLGAMREAFATYAWADRLRRRMAPIAQTDLRLIHSFADHVRFYADPRNLPLASFLWGGDRDRGGDDRSIQELPRIGESAPHQQIAAICERIRAAGATAYAVDLTTEDVRRAGLSVWKVVSPELQPLDVGYDRRYLGGARLAAWAGELGTRSCARPAALNPWPHLFP
jgi:ribosomal protein S12 methylthiotransferase accessory factor